MRDYLEFFGLKDDPFKITPDSNYFFLSESHQEALSSLRYLLDTEEGFAVIIGEPGTGKTLTIRKFLDDIRQDQVRYAYVLFPNLTPEELFEAILEDFGIKSEGETKNKLFSKLRDLLIRERSAGRKVLIVIDEAQNLPTETLEELRILSNLETDDMKLLQIILLGQPELEEKLNSVELRQLKQRITVMVKLRNFSQEETKAYIDYRISRAGGGNLRIGKKAYEKVYAYSLGIPRVINIIMERALMAAFVDTSHEIKPSHIDRAAESIGLRVKGTSLSKWVAYVGVGALVVSAVLFYGTQLYLKYKSIKSYENTYTQRKAEVNTTPAVAETEEETDQVEEKMVYVAVPMLNMRAQPNTKADKIYLLKEGDELKVVGKGPGTWIRVIYDDGEVQIEGWVNGKYVR